MKCIWFVLVVLLCADAAHARRFAVLIGNNVGHATEAQLRFAEDDAERLAQTLIAVADFGADDVVVLRGASPAIVRRALISINAEIRDETEPVLFFVFYSGHADANALHLGGENLELGEIEGITRGSPAAFRVLVLDACRSGSLTQVKGSTPAPAFAMPPLPDNVSGFVVLTAAAAGEDAAEADTLGASFFSHALSSGLLGAADENNDSRVSLEEAYENAFHQTVKSSSMTLSGIQHPTFRYEVRGKGELVLSDLRRADTQRGRLRLPAEIGFIVIDERGRVVAEVAAGANHRLSLAAGRYAVRGRAARVVYEGAATVVAGIDETLAMSSLSRIEHARFVRKGGDVAPGISAAIAVGGHVSSGVTEVGQPCYGARAQAPIDTPWFTLSPRLTWCRGEWANDTIHAVEQQLELAVDVHRYVDFDVVSVGVGAVVGGVWSRQDFVTRGIAPARQALSPAFGIIVDAVVPLPAGLFVSTAIDALTVIVRRRGQLDSDVDVATPLTIGATLSLGWRFF